MTDDQAGAEGSTFESLRARGADVDIVVEATSDGRYTVRHRMSGVPWVMPDLTEVEAEIVAVEQKQRDLG